MSSGRVFLTLTGTTSDERAWWKRKLGNVTVVLIDTDAAICVERIKNDPDRNEVAQTHVDLIAKWDSLFGDSGWNVDFALFGEVGEVEKLGVFSGDRRPNFSLDLISPKIGPKTPENDNFGPGFC